MMRILLEILAAGIATAVAWVLVEAVKEMLRCKNDDDDFGVYWDVRNENVQRLRWNQTAGDRVP